MSSGCSPVTRFAAAVRFLTRIPAGKRESGLPRGALVWFPVVGAGIGLLIAAVYALMLQGVPPLLAATVAVSVGVVITGALHEDGLADTLDAFGGSHDRQRTLEILTDPRIGVFGVMGVILSVLVRVTALAGLSRWEGVVALVAAHTVARGAAVLLLAVTPPARTTGLGAALRPSSSSGWVTYLLGVVIAGTLLLGWVLPVAAVGVAAVWGVRRWALGKIGGATGDVAGAVEQVVEILVLVGVAVIVFTVTDGAAWWMR